MDLLGGENMLTDLRHHWVEQPGGLPNPIAQGRAVEVKTFAGIDFALAVERKVVAVFRHQQMGQRGRSGATARGWHRWRRGLGNRIAGGAGIFRPHVPDHLEVARHVIQNLGHVLAELGHPFAAVGALAGTIIARLMHDLLARQMIGQRLALWFGALTGRRRRFGGIGPGVGIGFRLGFGRAGFQFLKPQFELFDLPGDPL